MEGHAPSCPKYEAIVLWSRSGVFQQTPFKSMASGKCHKFSGRDAGATAAILNERLTQYDVANAARYDWNEQQQEPHIMKSVGLSEQI
jgi:hypothetical protein